MAKIGGQVEDRLYPNHLDASVFSDGEYQRRYDAVGELMKAKQLDVILFYAARGSGDVHYLSNWIPSMECYLFWPAAGDPTLFVQLFNHVPQAEVVSIIDDVRFGGSNERGTVDSIPTVIAELKARGMAGGRVGLSGGVSYKGYARLIAELPDVEFVDVTGDMKNIRAIRSEEEFERISRAAHLSDLAIEALAEQARPGLTEIDLGRIVDEAQNQQGGYTTLRHITSTPMGNPSSCVPSKYLTDRKLEKGDAFVVELSAGWGGYSGQVLRTYAVGAPPTAQFKEMHEVCVRAFEAAKATIKDGSPIEDLLDAVDLIDQSGYSICDDLLHGANQFPPILRTWQTSHGVPKGMTFQEDMAVVLQPNVITKDRSAGVQYGHMLRVAKNEAVDLHHAPEGLLQCGD